MPDPTDTELAAWAAEQGGEWPDDFDPVNVPVDWGGLAWIHPRLTRSGYPATAEDRRALLLAWWRAEEGDND